MDMLFATMGIILLFLIEGESTLILKDNTKLNDHNSTTISSDLSERIQFSNTVPLEDSSKNITNLQKRSHKFRCIVNFQKRSDRLRCIMNLQKRSNAMRCPKGISHRDCYYLMMAIWVRHLVGVDTGR